MATEVGIIHQMNKVVPNKKLIPAPPDKNCSCNECPYMKLNTLEKLYECMKHKSPQIIMERDLMNAALIPIERMLEMS